MSVMGHRTLIEDLIMDARALAARLEDAHQSSPPGYGDADDRLAQAERMIGRLADELERFKED